MQENGQIIKKANIYEKINLNFLTFAALTNEFETVSELRRCRY